MIDRSEVRMGPVLGCGPAVRALVAATFPDGPPDGGVAGKPAFVTDSVAARPLFFPGGSLGELAVHGAVNALATAGALPRYLVAGLAVAADLPTEDLRRILHGMRAAADRAGVRVVAGSSSVLPPSTPAGDGGCRIDVTGVGVIRGRHRLGVSRARPGDAVLVSGPVGEHGGALVLGRDDVRSDSAPLHEPVAALLAAAAGVRVLRTAGRGGVAAALAEVARASRVSVRLLAEAVPVRREVRVAAQLLGVDPLHLACEGRVVVVVAGAQAGAGLAALRAHPLGAGAARIGLIAADQPGSVLLDGARLE
ncbi:AIR synthase-related protein [Saccharopolyspora sp. MS10]|uniref:AIR synthase-related protein n=1 Tax=Saccharopolyspora sp. MS10 TaxID=3385973 RepID=UPI0039A2ACB1